LWLNKYTKQQKQKKVNKMMDSTTSQISPVTINEVLELASWDRPRSTDELHSFISTRESIVFDR